jgi:hypothetical protein
MTPITEGMTPAQFLTAINDNCTVGGFQNTPKTIIDSIQNWEFKSTLGLNGISTTGLNYGISGQSFISKINNSFNSISLIDKVVTGVVDVKTFGATGDGTTDDAASIQAAVNAGNIIIQNGTFKLTTSIKIPSNRTVYLWNCKVKMAKSLD